MDVTNTFPQLSITFEIDLIHITYVFVYASILYVLLNTHYQISYTLTLH